MTSSRSDAHDVSVADLVTDIAPLAWQEAVALVRQVAQHVIATGRVGIPPLSDIWLEADGTVRVGRSATDEAPVAGLAGLLGALLPSSAPEQLKQLSNVRDEQISLAGAQEYLSALSFFARPDDHAELIAVVARARAAREARERAEALHALTDKARQAAATPPAVAATPRKAMSYRRLAMGLGVLTLAAIPVVAAVRFMGRKGGSPTHQPGSSDANSTLAHRVHSTVASVADAVRGAFEATPAPESDRSKDIVLASPRVRADRQSSKSKTAPEPADAGSASEAPPPIAAAPPPAVEDEAEKVAASPVASAVYTAADATVTPPKLTRAQMPDVVKDRTSDDRRGVLELLVGEDGQVLSAKLLSQAARHQERMMISAAKAWRFTPAMHNGVPVRYRLQMPITW